MSSWAFVAIVAIFIWGIVQLIKSRDRASIDDRRSNPEQPDALEAEREIQELRERIRVLERIATDANSSEARKIQDISDEIDSLRDK